MTVTATEIATLRKAINSGATRVSYGDKSVEYRSLTEMKETLAAMEREYASVTRTRQFRFIAPADKGL